MEVVGKTFFTPPNPDFPYQEVCTPLDSANTEIRLLRLLPGSYDEEIACQLTEGVPLPAADSQRQATTSSKSWRPFRKTERTARERFREHDIINAPQYEALSYCAGDPNDSQPILVNSKRFNVFSSLYSALKHLRRPDTYRMLWVDQICINQTDLKERSSQVLKMSEIYANADAVQIWLGEDSAAPECGLAFAFCRQFLAENRIHLQQSINRFDDGNSDTITATRKWTYEYDFRDVDYTRLDLDLKQALLWLETTMTDDLYRGRWAAFFNIFSWPWWTRCWIVQETVVAKRAYLMCGVNSIDWEDFSKIFLVFSRSSIGSSPRPGQALELWGEDRGRALRHMYLAELIDFRRTVRFLVPEGERLFGYLQPLRHFSASDMRDHVYARLGLLEKKWRSQYGIIPNYAEENRATDVFVEVAKSIIVVEDSLDVLADAIGDEAEPGLPSWAPNWAHRRIERLGIEPTFFSASGSHDRLPSFWGKIAY